MHSEYQKFILDCIKRHIPEKWIASIVHVHVWITITITKTLLAKMLPGSQRKSVISKNFKQKCSLIASLKKSDLTTVKVTLTLTTLGTFVAAFIKSSDAKCVLLRTRSREGPISSTSIRGVRLPDFFSNTLKNKIFTSYWSHLDIEKRKTMNWLVYWRTIPHQHTIFSVLRIAWNF